MKKVCLVLAVVVSMFMSGCGANRIMVSQDFKARMPEIKKIGVILSDVSVQEVSVGGSKELMVPETSLAMPIVEKVAVESAKDLNFDAKLLPVNNDIRKITAPYNRIQQQELYRMLADRDAKPVTDEFSTIAEKTDVDAFLVFRSCENESSGGRKAVKVLAILAGGYAGGESTYSDISLVDKKGRLLYYNSKASGDTLRDEGDVKDIFKGLLEKLHEERAKI